MVFDSKEKPYRIIRHVHNDIPPKYRLVQRTLSRGDHFGGVRPPTRTEITELLESLQSIAFAKYNEVQTAVPSEDKQKTKIENEKEIKAKPVAAANTADKSPSKVEPVEPKRKLAESAKLVHDLLVPHDIVVNVDDGIPDQAPVSPLRKSTRTWLTSEPADAVPRRASEPVPRVPLFEPPTHQPETHPPAPSLPPLEEEAVPGEISDLSFSSEEIEAIYLKSLADARESRRSRTSALPTLSLHQLREGTPKALKDPDLPSLNVDEDGNEEEPQSKLEDPPHPSRRRESGIQWGGKEPQEPPDAEIVELPARGVISDWVPQLRPDAANNQKYHILGFDVRSKYLAHRLSGSLLRPPVHMLVRDPQVPQAWESRGKVMTLHRDRRLYAHTRILPELVHSFRPGQIVHRHPAERKEDESAIENLFITAPARTIMAELRPIAHRITNQTTIVLIQDGLGIPEALNLKFFNDPTTRPKYIEGHLSALLYSLKDDPFAVKEMARGSLYLSTRMKDPDVLITKFPDQDLYGPTKLLQSLTTVRDLDMVPCARAMFLFHKLPSVMAQSIVEPLSVLVDGRYSKIPLGYPNNRLIERMLMEMCAIVTAMPEFAAFPNAQHYFNYDKGKIRNRCLAMLTKRAKTSDKSQMWRLIEAGKVTDIMYLNGYFSSRAEDLGIRCPANDAVVNLVKAKHESKLRDLKADIQFDGWTKSLT